jgi:hypothetical protein
MVLCNQLHRNFACAVCVWVCARTPVRVLVFRWWQTMRKTPSVLHCSHGGHAGHKMEQLWCIGMSYQDYAGSECGSRCLPYVRIYRMCGTYAG